MQRRTMLGLGVAGGVLLALAGAGATWIYEPAWRNGKLLPGGRGVFTGVARAVLEGSLPAQASAQALVIEAHLLRMEAMLQAIPPHVQTEVADLLALLSLPPTRVAFTGLSLPWDTAPVADVQTALQSMRRSSLLLRRQAYGALRDLTHAAYFADASTWELLRYPGPRTVA